MISKEKSFQTLRSLNITIIVIVSIASVLGLFAFISLLFLAANIDEVIKQSTITPEMAEGIRASITPVAFIQQIGALAVNIAMLVLAILNGKKIKRKELPSKILYYVGGAYYLYSLGTTAILTLTTDGAFSMIGFIIPILFALPHLFSFLKVNQLEQEFATDDIIQ